MKLNTLLTGGFLIVAILCGVVGYIAINTFEKVNEINTELQTDIQPATLLMSEMRDLATKVRFLETKYIVYRKFKGKSAKTKKDLNDAMGELKKAADEHFEYERHISRKNRLDAQQLLDEVATLNYAVNGILDFIDVQVGYTEEIHGQIAEMENETVDSAYRALTEDIEMHKAEHMQELSNKHETVILAHKTGTTTILTATIIIVILAMALGIIISRSISKPILKLRDATAEVAKGKLDTKVEINSRNEIGQLSRAFDEMTQNLKKTEERVRQYNEKLIRSNEELEQFAYVASHDLQEPLRMISSYTQLLERRYKDKLDDDANEFIYYVVDGACRMQRLINDLLDFSRITTRGKTFEEVDTYSILGQALSNVHQLISDAAAIVTNDDLPIIYADESQLVRVFQNLIDNAIKFCSKRIPHIHVSAKKKEDEWVFSISDNGIGIDEQFQDRIFTVFQRLHGKDKYPGTGIGLAICRRIVERHDGRIWFESELDKGAIFYFTIPKTRGHSNGRKKNRQTC